MIYRWFVGIDVSKAELAVCIFEATENARHRFTVKNNPRGFAKLVRTLLARQVAISQTVICLENTGVYDDRLVAHLHENGWAVSIGKTTILKSVRPEHHRKDDGFDADLAAEYAHRFQDKLELHIPSPPVIEELRALYAERRRLVTRRAAILKLRREAHLRTHPTKTLIKLWRRRKAFYDRQIEDIERFMFELVKTDRQVYRRFKQMRAVFGELTALMWVTLFFGQERLNARRIASRFGHAPHGTQSGKMKKRDRTTGHGNGEMRRLFTMCAWSKGRYHPRFIAYKQKKLAQGKSRTLITNNIINKLIRIACAVWNQDGEFDPMYQSPFERMTVAA
jgi:transposase